jgi:hypothetical protein
MRIGKMEINQGIYLLNEEGEDGYFNGTSLKYLYIVSNIKDLSIAI